MTGVYAGRSGRWVRTDGLLGPTFGAPAGFQLDTTKPTAELVGYRGAGVSEAQLANYAGSLTNVQAGDTLDRLAITGWVNANASNFTLRESLVLVGPESAPGTTTPTPALRTWTNGVSGTRFEFVEVAPSHPSVGLYGFHGFDGVLSRVHIHDATDLAVLFKQNVQVLGCLLERSRWWAVDPRQVDGSHNDIMQIEGGTTFLIRGSALDAGIGPDAARADGDPGANFAILATQNYAVMNNLHILYNWFDGNPYSHIQLEEKGKGAMSNVSITGNRFGQYSRNACIRGSLATIGAASIAGNTGPDGLPLAGAQIQATAALP